MAKKKGTDKSKKPQKKMEDGVQNDNRGPNWGKNGFDKRGSKAAAEAQAIGAKTPRSAKKRLLASIGEEEIDILIKARKAFMKIMMEDLEKGHTAKYEFWEKTTGNHKDTSKIEVEVEKDVKEVDRSLDINVNLTVDKPQKPKDK